MQSSSNAIEFHISPTGVIGFVYEYTDSVAGYNHGNDTGF